MSYSDASNVVDSAIVNFEQAVILGSFVRVCVSCVLCVYIIAPYGLNTSF